MHLAAPICPMSSTLMPWCSNFLFPLTATSTWRRVVGIQSPISTRASHSEHVTPTGAAHCPNDVICCCEQVLLLCDPSSVEWLGGDEWPALCVDELDGDARGLAAEERGERGGHGGGSPPATARALPVVRSGPPLLPRYCTSSSTTYTITYHYVAACSTGSEPTVELVVRSSTETYR